MRVSPAVVEEVKQRFERSGTSLQKAATRTIIPAAAAPRSFWQKRGLDLTPDGREFRTILPAAPSALDGVSLGADLRAERVLGTSDLLEVVFLQAALCVARTVARVRVNGATGMLRGYGTGFMVSPRLLLTNWHVLPTPDVAAASIAEFGYETRLGEGAPQAGAAFKLEPGKFFLAEQALDYALVAVAPSGSAGRTLGEFGFNRLIDNDTDLITKGQFANIIQHPSGQPKQLAFRQNEIVGKVDDFLQYRADTAPGSSGAPVFNDQWQVVALHHAGVWETNAAGQILAIDGSVWNEAMGDDRIKWIANEGVRVPRLIDRWRNPGRPLPAGFIDEIFNPDVPSVTEGAMPIAPPDNRCARADAAIGPSAGNSDLTASIAPDGTATWTLPLKISISLGLHPSVAAASAATAVYPAGAVEAPAAKVGPIKAAAEAPQDLETVLRKARKTLMHGRTDVIGIRAGWYYDDDGMTDRRAIVVTVRSRKTPAELQADRVTELPTSFMGYPVQVAAPTVEELLRASVQPIATEALFGAAAAPFEIKYTPPEGLDLRPVEARMRVIAHVSPDAGWPTLKTFIAGARTRLTVAMYEFTAEHIREALTEVAQKRSFKTLSLTLDSARGSLKNPDTVRDSDAMARDLREALGDKLEVSWVRIGSVNGWVNHDYHIKVMVRDGTAFWLSSGNWKDSGQPDADPRGDDALLRKLIDKQNREWHAIIEHKGLAETYELAIRGDFDANRGTRPEELAAMLPELYYLPGVRAEAREAERSLTYFEPFDDDRVFKVQPILTPDNYLDVVLPAIKAATSSLLIQNQSLATPPDNPDDRYVEFWNVVRDQQRRGRDVRLIFRIMERSPWDARATHEKLRDLGLDPKRIKVQFGCHTKGILIDGERVVLGSHNLTNMGATTNRDASLLFDDAPLAEYFGKIFEHDWENVAVKVTPSLWKRGELYLAERGVAPEGFLPFDWADWMEAR